MNSDNRIWYDRRFFLQALIAFGIVFTSLSLLGWVNRANEWWIFGTSFLNVFTVLFAFFTFVSISKAAWKLGKKSLAVMIFSIAPAMLLILIYLGFRIDYSNAHDRAETNAYEDAQNKLLSDQSLAQNVRKMLSKSLPAAVGTDRLGQSPVPPNQKILVVNNKEQVDPVHFLLPREMHPATANDVNAIVLIDCSLREVGRYTDGSSAKAETCCVSIMSRTKQTLLETPNYFYGEVPHEKRYSHSAIEYVGRVPPEEMAKYIRGLFH